MRKLSILFIVATFSVTLHSQESSEMRLKALEDKVAKMGELKFSGYIQTQWTWKEADTGTGKQNDFTVRRGRIKADYINKYGEAVIQLDVTENGVDIKDAYFRVTGPRIEWASLRAGVFDRPFGYEISYSSARRETPERSLLFRTLFPRERDMGAEVILKGPENNFLKDFTLNAGLFTGNGGQARETDSRKDFIGHLAYQKSVDNMSFGLGTSLYYGGVRLAGDENQKAFKMVDKTFVEDTGLKPGDYAKRRYYGFDGQFSVVSQIGRSSLRAEYLWGAQPGLETTTNSPTGAIVADIYSRKFNGCYVYFIQGIGSSKHSFVARYDRYDPNSKVSGNDCQTMGDITYSTIGLGWLMDVNANFQIMCNYEMVSNEKVNNALLAGDYSKNIPDDVFTLRLQYRF